MVATTESKRVQWSQSSYLRTRFDTLERELLDAGICDVNSHFDPSSREARKNPMCTFNCPIVWKSDEAGRVISFDETYWTPDGVTSRPQRVLISAAENQAYAEVRVNKSAERCTIVGGSAANGDALQPMIIYKGKSIAVSQFVGFPGSFGRNDPATGKPFPAVPHANGSGGMTNDMGPVYLDEVIAPFTQKDRNAGKKIILILDGHGSHVTLAFLKRCKELGIVVILRVPHTTHLTQGEDVENFGKFKRAANAEQAVLSVKYGVAEMRGERHDDQVTMEDFIQAAAPAWRLAFDPPVNKSAWYKIGINPFSRKPMQDLYAKEWEAALHHKRRGVKREWKTRSLEEIFPTSTVQTMPESLVGVRVRTGRISLSGKPATDEGWVSLLQEKSDDAERKEKQKADKQEQRQAKKAKIADTGGDIWRKVIDDELKLNQLSGPQLNAVGAYKGMTFAAGRACADGTKSQPKVQEKKDQIRAKCFVELPQSQQ